MMTAKKHDALYQAGSFYLQALTAFLYAFHNNKTDTLSEKLEYLQQRRSRLEGIPRKRRIKEDPEFDFLVFCADQVLQVCVGTSQYPPLIPTYKALVLLQGDRKDSAFPAYHEMLRKIECVKERYNFHAWHATAIEQPQPKKRGNKKN